MLLCHARGSGPHYSAFHVYYHSIHGTGDARLHRQCMSKAAASRWSSRATRTEKPKTLQNELRLSSVTWAGQACKSLPARVPVPGQQRASTNSCCFASLPKPAWQVMFAISSLSLSLRVRLDGRAWPVLFGAAIPRHRQFLGGLVKPDEHCKKV